MSAPKKRRRPAGAESRRQLATALWTFGIILVLIGGGIVAKIATSKTASPPASPLPGPTIASCTGEQPHVPLRDPGPFAAPSKDAIDADHIYVATIKTYCGDLAFKIDPGDAPEAARSFVFLARKRFFDGLSFDSVVQGLGAFAARADPGYTLVSRTGKPFGRGDLVMVDVDPDTAIRVGSKFVILTETVQHGLAGVRIGVSLEGQSAANQTTLARLMEQPVAGTTPARTLYIVHVDIQEFTR
jgi:hypothetical protein